MFDAQLPVGNEFSDEFKGCNEPVVLCDKLVADGLLYALGFGVAVGNEVWNFGSVDVRLHQVERSDGSLDDGQNLLLMGIAEYLSPYTTFSEVSSRC